LLHVLFIVAQTKRNSSCRFRGDLRAGVAARVGGEPQSLKQWPKEAQKLSRLLASFVPFCGQPALEKSSNMSKSVCELSVIGGKK
jgi:hypothetical protein